MRTPDWSLKAILALAIASLLLASSPAYSESKSPLRADGGSDYGDAPASYGTYSESAGACHEIGSLYLGGPPDAEGDGQPSEDALGDDDALIGSDDEDGVALSGLLYPGMTYLVLWESSGTGYLDAWIDFDINGTFDADEKICDSVAVSAGPDSHTTFVPMDATPGVTYARFRLSSAGGLGPTGSAPDGEVEDRRVIIMEGDDCYDRGDAPEPYPDAWGARRPTAALGSWIDSEDSMQRSSDATGDDTNGTTDDEDGVMCPGDLDPFVAGETGDVNILVISEQLNPTLSAKALFDWNQDGDWADDGESYTLSGLVEGNNWRDIDVPAGASDGDTFARIELYSSTNLQEIEDYQVPVEGSSTVDFILELEAGWNVVSVPLTLSPNTPGDVFPDATDIYGWNPTTKQYFEPTEIVPEHGYWVAMSEDDSLTLNGLPCPGWTSTDIKMGWNMIGSVHGSTEEFTDPDDVDDGSVEGAAFWWDPSVKTYLDCTTIQPGKGYWAEATEDCSLTLGSPAF